jgi:hypothetical protein
MRMREVFGGTGLDWVLFFSSLQSFLRLPGQSSYAAGCAFTDACARRWASETGDQVRIINWGYWGAVGVVAGREFRTRMRAHGVGSIDARAGMAAIDALFAQSQPQLGFAKGSGSLSMAGIELHETVQEAAESPSMIDELCSAPAAGVRH